jgi:hypothetical protein
MQNHSVKAFYKNYKEVVKNNPSSPLSLFGKKMEENFRCWARLQDLGEELKRMATDLDAGKPINPQALKKMGGQVQWWAQRFFYL